MRAAAALLGAILLLVAAPEAHAGTAPYRVAADGVTDSAITISWVTTTAESGHVVWGASASSLSTTTHDSRGSSTSSTVHHVVLTGLSESTTYHWKIVSGGTQHGDASGSAFQTTTGPSLVLVGSRVVAGKVLEAGGGAATGALVHVTLRDADGSGSSGDSQSRTALTDSSGLWQFSLESFRTTGLGGGFSVSAMGDSILVTADGGALGTVASTTDSGAASASPTTITSSLAAPGIPTVTGVSPSQGTITVATDLTVTGTDFLFATSAALGDAAATSLASFVVVSDSVVTGRVPAGVSAGTYAVRVSSPAGTSSSSSGSFTATVPPDVTDASLPGATAGRPYSRAVAVSGGAAPLAWTVVTGTPPAGLTLSTAGVLSGTPSSSGTSQFTVRVTDRSGVTDDQQLTLVVAAALTTPAGTLPDWTRDRLYGSSEVSTTDGTDPVSWTLTGLPTGLAVSGSGRTRTVSGTPTSTGLHTVVATATDSLGSTASRTWSVVIHDPPSVPSGTLPDWTRGVSYGTRSVTTTGGTDPVAWTVSGLPAGLSSSAGGRTLSVSGTPTAEGSFSVTITATDAAGASASRTATLVIHAPLTQPSGALPDWTEGRAYGSRTIATTGGTDPVTWTIAGLPPGLASTASSRTATVSGTPTAPGDYTVTATATDAAGATVTANFLVRVSAPIAAPSGTLPAWTEGRDYGTRTLTASGGTDPVAWTTSGLPAGLVATADGRTLSVSGTPTAAGTFTVTATATDVAGSAAERSFTVVIASPLAAPSGSLPDWTIGRDYAAATLTTTGGTDSIAWSFSGLPTGLTASASGRTATVTGRPTTVGTFTVRATVTDAAGSSAASDLMVVVNGALAAPAGTLPSWTVQRDYGTRTLSVSGGTLPLSWNVSGLPDGLTGTPAGRDFRVTGTPSKEGTFVVLATATDAAGATSSAGWLVTIHAPIAKPSGALPDWTAGRDYGTRSITVNGGTDPVVWSFSGIPTGLSASPSGRTAEIRGTPTVSGTHSVKLTATDATGAATIFAADVTIHAPVRITTSDLGGWTVGREYARTLERADGTPPFRWELVSGGVPGLRFDAVSATYSGLPSMEGEFPAGFRVVDAAGSSSERELTLTVHPVVALADATLPFASVGRPYVAGVAWTGGTPPHTATIVSAGSPAWLAVGAETGAFTGTPDAPGVHDVAVEVADVTGSKIVRTFRVEVAAVVPLDAASPPEFAVPEGAARVLLAFDALRASDVAFKFRRADREKLPASVRLLRADGAEVPSRKPPKAVRTRAGLSVTLPETAATDRYFLSIDGLAGEAFTLVAQPKLRIATRFRGKLDIAPGAVVPCGFPAPEGATVVIRLEHGRDVRFVRWTNVQTSESATLDAPGPKLRIDHLAAWGDQVLECDVPSGEAARVRYEVVVTPRK